MITQPQFPRVNLKISSPEDPKSIDIRSRVHQSDPMHVFMTPYHARGHPASEWPLAGQPCKVDWDLHTIARAHNLLNGCSPIGTLCPRVAEVL